MRRPRIVDAFACALACLALVALAPPPAAGLYPLDWLPGPIIGMFGPILVLLALLGPRHAWVWGVVGLVMGGVVGHVVGEPIYQARLDRFLAEVAAGGDIAAGPAHPGWWIAVLVCAAWTAAGLVVHRAGAPRAARLQA